MNENLHINLDELPEGHPLRRHPLEATDAGVPDGYFDRLPSRIQARVVQPERQPLISWSWRRTAASLAGAGLVAALVWQTWPVRQDSLGTEALSGVSRQAIATYLDEQNLSTEELSDIEAVSVGAQGPTLQYLDVSPDAIRQTLDTQTPDNVPTSDS